MKDADKLAIVYKIDFDKIREMREEALDTRIEQIDDELDIHRRNYEILENAKTMLKDIEFLLKSFRFNYNNNSPTETMEGLVEQIDKSLGRLNSTMDTLKSSDSEIIQEALVRLEDVTAAIKSIIEDLGYSL